MSWALVINFLDFGEIMEFIVFGNKFIYYRFDLKIIKILQFK